SPPRLGVKPPISPRTTHCRLSFPKPIVLSPARARRRPRSLPCDEHLRRIGDIAAQRPHRSGVRLESRRVSRSAPTPRNNIPDTRSDGRSLSRCPRYSDVPHFSSADRLGVAVCVHCGGATIPC